MSKKSKAGAGSKRAQRLMKAKAQKKASKAAGMGNPGGQSRYALRGVQPAKVDPERRDPWWLRGDGVRGLHGMSDEGPRIRERKPEHMSWREWREAA